MNKAQKMRDLLKSDQLIRLVGAHDGLSAKLVERAGFDAVWASSLEISASFGVPDASILPMTHFLQAAYVMHCATKLPIIADCNNGFGNVNNVIYLVKEYERHGIAGICLEDQAFPKNNSFSPRGQKLAPVEEFTEKIRVAKATKENPDFIIIARIESFIVGRELEEALRRAYSYQEAGADVIAIHSKLDTPTEIQQFMQVWPNSTPILIIPTTYPQITLRQIEELGIRMVIYANHGLRSSIKSMKIHLEELYRTGDLASIDNKIASIEEVFELQDAGYWPTNL